MISKLFSSLYARVFVNIVVENTQSLVFVEICSSKKVERSMHKYFATTTMNAQMHEFISTFYKESPFCYISVLDKSLAQGAMPTCTTSEMGKYCDINASEYRCYSNDWAFYTSEYDLEAIKHDYRSIGIDFIFSPFALLANFFKDKIDSTLSIFVLVESNSLSFTVFDNGKLLYGEYLSMKHSKGSDALLVDSSLDEELDAGMIDGIDLEDIAIEDDASGFEDFGVIEDLDADDTMDEFSEEAVPNEVVHEKEQHTPSSGVFNEDYQRFVLVQSALNTFYKDPKYKSQFVESIYIADSVGVSSDFKNYLEEEIFLTVFIRRIDLGASLCDMAKAEV
ncbi:MAG: hypothetical protein PHX44_01860 [Sulfurimonas sp.]|uniref:hypothetical protein n=1 Tax=Sulfurimonas sp. TaxID=2022749 RepID=UPI002604AE4C|nr:hypothetical protein [Sulfurimonas sp.]MDD2651779.1 hypothetical protein [Sulfurimonas sp.]MDD3451669.1 hypothetical protein [Sulfurimonas sp.]